MVVKREEPHTRQLKRNDETAKSESIVHSIGPGGRRPSDGGQFVARVELYTLKDLFGHGNRRNTSCTEALEAGVVEPTLQSVIPRGQLVGA